MDYGKIIKRAWQITTERRFLWGLGILAVFAGGGGLRGFSFPSASSSSTNQNPDFDHFQSLAQNWMHDHAATLGIIVVVFFILLLTLLYVSLTANAGLMLSVHALEQEHQKILGFKKAYHEGRAYVWRLLGLGLVIGLLMVLVTIALAAPTIALAILVTITQFAIPFAVLMGLAAVGGFIVAVLYASLISKIAERIVVLENKRVIAALMEARRLVHQLFHDAALTWLIGTGVGILASLGLMIALMLCLVIVALPLIALGFALYYAAGQAAVVVLISFGVCVFVVLMLIAGGIYASFFSSYWTISFKALRFLQHQQKA